MANRFTNAAISALNEAKKAAKEFGSGAVGTEHILIGLLRIEEGTAYEVLKELNIKPGDVEELIRRYLISNYSVIEFSGFEFTPMSNRILNDSAEKARLYKSDAIGTEHLLLGILGHQNCSACRVLTSLGISLERLHVEVISIIQGENRTKTSGGNVRSGKDAKSSSTPTLDQYSRDLTKMAADGKLDPVIGRQNEISRIIQILSRRTKNNPCPIGEPGVGKTAVIEGLALRIANQEVPDIMNGKRLVSLDLSGMVAGSKYRGEFEERIKNVIREVSEDRSIILFIDEIHTIIGAGGAEGALDAANIIKPSLARGEIQLIGATTVTEYRKHIEKDAALERRFQPVMVEEPTEEESVEILKGLRKTYEDHHRVLITDEALNAAVHLSARYISDRFLPDKAIDLIDEASSKIRLSTYVQPKEIKKLEDEIRQIEAEKEEAVFNQEYERASELKKQQEKKQARIEKVRERWEKSQQEDRPSVTEEEIADIVSSWTKIPVKSIKETEANTLIHLEDTLQKRVVGQEEAVRVIDRALASAGSGTYQIQLIHGYHRGTNLRSMIKDWYQYDSRVKRIIPGDNPGITVLILKELY